MKILLVEDNLLNQKIVAYYLKKFKYEVISVTNWRDAMDQFINNRPDLILMDLMLPEKSGYEITDEIRKYEQKSGQNINIPIIALTANTLDNDKEKCIAAGMNDYISKPFSSEDLHKIVSNYIK